MKKLLILMIILGSSYAYGMQNKEQIMLEDRLLVALNNGKLADVKAAIEAGAPVNEIKYLLPYKGEEPLQRALAQGHLEIADYLLSRGADKTILNRFLLHAVRSADVETIKWLLARGAQDTDGEALYYAKEYKETAFRAKEKATHDQIIKLLEQAKTASKRKSVRPSKGIFKELETEEFLSKK